MSNQNGGKTVAIAPYDQKVQTIRALFERAKAQIAVALPSHLDADRMLRIAMTSIQRTPALLDCDPRSLLACVVGAAQLGLEPDSGLGHAYLIPYKDRATLIVGYRGMVELARRSGHIQSIHARAVYDNDSFTYRYGLDEQVDHVPGEPGENRKLTFAYAIARLKGGGTQFEVMSRSEIERIRTRSRAGQSGPWTTDYEEMAKKTVVRRLFKLLPVSIELATAIEHNDRADIGEPQFIDEVIPEQPAEKPAKTTAALTERAKEAAKCDGAHPGSHCADAACYLREPSLSR